MKAPNWNTSARKELITAGPQNPYRIYIYDKDGYYIARRFKPGSAPTYENDIVARFTVKYTVK